MILLLILFFIIATAIAFVFFFGLGCFVIGSAPILDIVAVWIATIYFLYKPVASIAANFIVGFILNVIVWIVIIALYIGLLLFFQKFLNPLYRLFTLAISILGFFLGWALVLEIILHLFNVLAAGFHLVTFNFSSEPEAKVFLSNYIAPVFGDMNGIILFKFKIINQIINGIILILGSAFLYYVRIHALGEFTYTELIMQGLNPFKKENRYIDYEERKYKKEKLSKSKKIKESQNFKSNSTDYKKSYNENNSDKNNYQTNNDYYKSKSNDKDDLNIEYILACAKLGVDPNDSFEKIKTRYRFIMSNLHPDSTSNSSESTEYIQQINQAYDIIKKYNKK